MTSTVYIDSKAQEMFSRMDTAIKSVMVFLKALESRRELKELKNLKGEENRLKKCIDDIEDFHRDMFLLLKKEGKQDASKKIPAKKDHCNEYCVTEPDPMEQDSMSDSDFDEPEGSINRRKSLILKIPRYLVNNLNASNDESDHSYRASRENNIEAVVDIYESDDENDKSSDDMDESVECEDGVEDESVKCQDGVEDESSDMKEQAKKVVLDFLGNKEKEITELVLHLIKEFSRFQRRLRTTEKKANPTTLSALGGSILKTKLKSLYGSVLYLDKTVTNIYANYSEMLQQLGNLFELNL